MNVGNLARAFFSIAISIAFLTQCLQESELPAHLQKSTHPSISVLQPPFSTVFGIWATYPQNVVKGESCRHTIGLIVQVDTPKESFQAFLESLGVEEPEYRKTAPFDDAISGDEADIVAVASMEGWTSVWGIAMMWATDDDVMKKLFKRTKAFTFTLEEATGTYLFEWWVNGVCKRKDMIQEGEVGISEGKPIPEEKEAFAQESDDEQRILLLMEKMTLPWKRLTKPKYHVFAVKDSTSDYLGAED